jgi:hypothetical protein
VDYVVVVDNPKPHHSYGIRWMWPARKAPYAASGDQLSSLDGRPGMSSRR